MSTSDAPLWRLPDVRRLVMVSLLGFASFCLTLASMPTWAVHGGAPQRLAGLVTTVMLITTVATQGLVPAMISRFGNGRTLAMGLVLLGLPAPLAGLSSHLAPLLVIAAIRGVGFAQLTVVGATLTGSVAPPRRHGETVGLYGLAIAVPNLLGVAGGVALTQAGLFPLAAGLAACPLLAVPLALRIGSGQAAAPGGAATPAPPRDPHASTWSVVLATLAPSAVLLVVTGAGGGLVTFLPLARPHGVLATGALLVYGAAAALSRWRAGVLADRIGAKVLLPGALLVTALGMLCVAGGLLGAPAGPNGRLPWDILLLAGALLFGAGYGAVQNLTLVIAFAKAGPVRQANASAVWNAAFDAGTAIGAVALGALASTGLGLPWSFAVTAAVVALFLPVALRQGAPTP
jgi:MFS family permease